MLLTRVQWSQILYFQENRIFHEHLTRSGLAFVCWMSKSHANVVSFDENVSYLLTSMNLYERNEQFFYERNSY